MNISAGRQLRGPAGREQHEDGGSVLSQHTRLAARLGQIARIDMPTPEVTHAARGDLNRFVELCS